MQYSLHLRPGPAGKNQGFEGRIWVSPERRTAGFHHIWSHAVQCAAFPENERHEVVGARAGFPQQAARSIRRKQGEPVWVGEPSEPHATYSLWTIGRQ